jgi:DNA ligase-1
MIIKKPMLAGKITDSNKIKFPVLATPKLDGIRCLTDGTTALSRTFKEIPNQHIQKVMKGLLANLDGELMVAGSFNDVQSAVMSEDGEPNFIYYVFDYVLPNTNTQLNTPYYLRMEDLKKLELPTFCVKVLPVLVNNMDELITYEEKCLIEGFEGVMIRSPDGPYKCGRSSEKQGYLLKVKRFEDSEAKITGFVEQLTNENEAEEDELGHTKRSTCQKNMIPNGHLGKFIATEIGDTPWKGKDLKIGGAKGMTKEMRKEIWENQDKYLGKIVKYTFQPHGVKDLPRLPIWIGFRDESDMS